MRHTLLYIVFWLLAVGASAQQPSTDFDFQKAEQALETIMQQPSADPETQQQASVIATLVGTWQFRSHRYEEAIRTLDYAISHTPTDDGIFQIHNHVFLIHALCLTRNHTALDRLRRLTSLLQRLQANTLRGDFPVEYADGTRNAMNRLLLPLTSLVAATFPDDETLSYCFNLMLYLKQFATTQLADCNPDDIRHTLLTDYRQQLSATLSDDEVAIELVPFTDIDQQRSRGTLYMAYILDHTGRLQFVEVCRKDEAEALLLHNDAPWTLYDPPSPLQQLVWQQLQPRMDGMRRIFLSPCGLLGRVNFLLFDDRIHELSSACELLKTYAPGPRRDAVLVGGIDYDQHAASTSRGDRDWGTLKGTQREVDSIARALAPRYAVTRLTKDEGSEQAVRQALGNAPRIVHFATHAICYADSLHRSQYGFFDFPSGYDPSRPELTYSGLVLAGGNQGFARTGDRPLTDDGILLSEEIAHLRLDGTALVVLSACNSAAGVFDDIYGTLGLVKAFKLAGAHTVIASLSRVDDQAASEFMACFYRRLAEGQPMHAAFAATIGHLKARYPRQPKFWAMFKIIDCPLP